MGGRELIAADVPALHPVFDGLPLGQVEPLLVDETALVLQTGHVCALLVAQRTLDAREHPDTTRNEAARPAAAPPHALSLQYLVGDP